MTSPSDPRSFGTDPEGPGERQADGAAGRCQPCAPAAAATCGLVLGEHGLAFAARGIGARKQHAVGGVDGPRDVDATNIDARRWDTKVVICWESSASLPDFRRYPLLRTACKVAPRSRSDSTAFQTAPRLTPSVSASSSPEWNSSSASCAYTLRPAAFHRSERLLAAQWLSSCPSLQVRIAIGRLPGARAAVRAAPSRPAFWRGWRGE